MDLIAWDRVLESGIRLSDLLGLSQLALDGARTITTVVEDVHASIAAPFDPFAASGPGRMGYTIGATLGLWGR